MGLKREVEEDDWEEESTSAAGQTQTQCSMKCKRCIKRGRKEREKRRGA
jgi:hypothetical protein